MIVLPSVCAFFLTFSLFPFFYKSRVFKKLRLFQHLDVFHSFSARRLLRISSGAEFVASTLQLISIFKVAAKKQHHIQYVQ